MTAAALALPISRLRAWTRRLVAAHLVAGEPAAPPPPPTIETRRVDPKRIGKGYADPRAGTKSRIVVTIEQHKLEQIHARAVARGVPVAVIIREFVDQGLQKSKQE